MTEGDPTGAPSPVVGHRRVLAIAVPMMLAHATTPLLGIVNATAVGRLGEPHLLGAVALGAVVFDLLFWTFGALRLATTGLTAQAHGSGDRGEVDAVAARALFLAGAIGTSLVLLQTPLSAAAAALSGASPDVADGFRAYFGIRVWAAPFTLANYVVLGSVIARGRTGLGLLVQVAINVANIAATSWLVAGAGWGVAGAATASLVAEGLGTLLGFAVLTGLGTRPLRVPRARLLARPALLRLLAVNRDVTIRTAALVLVYWLFVARGAREGDVVLAANSVLQNLWLVAGYILDGFATAGEALCGQALGAGRERDFRRAVRLALGWCCAFGIGLFAVVLLFGGTAIDAITVSPAVREAARALLPFAALMPAASAPSFAFDGIFIGATWTRAMRDLMLAALLVFLLAYWLGAGHGDASLWLAMIGFMVARGVGQGLAYPRLARASFPASPMPAPA